MEYCSGMLQQVDVNPAAAHMQELRIQQLFAEDLIKQAIAKGMEMAKAFYDNFIQEGIGVSHIQN